MEEQHALIERLFLERISLRGICRAVSVGLQWNVSIVRYGNESPGWCAHTS